MRNNMENKIRLTPENVFQYIGRDVIFKSRGNEIIKKIISCSSTGKSIKINHPDLNDCLQIVTRKVYVI